MIIGECPHDDCEHVAMRLLPTDVRLPVFSKETCEGCGEIVWVKYTRVDPIVYTEAQFAEEFTVDEENETNKGQTS
jgi:hypothetical protein